MRYPVEQKAETHERIVDAAARSFREHGSEAQGVARLMKDVGLTHGGFYRHFESKEELYVDAIARGFQEAADRMVAVAAKAPHGEQLRAIIEHYLSMEHLEDPTFTAFSSGEGRCREETPVHRPFSGNGGSNDDRSRHD
jgi:TetR/AcrR family transcriptional regulator, transcriptional repressor for nem operon